MQKHLLFYLAILCVFATQSCRNYQKIPYFQDTQRNTATKEAITNFTPLTIQPGDILGISVSSSNPEASAIFNYNLNTVTGTSVNNPSNPVIGYLVDQKGDIDLPLIGIVKVSGSTTSDIRVQLKKQLLTYLKEPTVNIRILNFKISVLGDVAKPGVYQVQNERITLTEAISLAGDLNITALRNNVMLVREIDGTREYIPIDLTSKKLFESPYYYLKSNDVIYIQPSRNKYATVDNNYRNIGLLLSALSIVVIILTR